MWEADIQTYTDDGIAQCACSSGLNQDAAELALIEP
jgi:hypothetical protein